MSAPVPICGPGGEGMIFPMGGAWEASLAGSLRGLVYGAAMVYFFLGISVVADIFMSSIEQVTKLRVQRQAAAGAGAKAGLRTELFWNETVATLTLMALGSSAPEIFLSVIDVMKKSFHFGSLGPSTIVGSASFNLFVIIAVCIVVIPPGETRLIENLPAFYITAFFSLLAYIWMAFILLVSSKDVVDVWEAVVTFLLLPALIYVSYKVDLGAGSGILRRFGILAQQAEDARDEDAGVFKFDEPVLRVPPGSGKPQQVEVVVFRHGARAESLGEASCSWRTEPLTAVPGFDFEEASGTLDFGQGETERRLELQITPKAWRLSSRRFIVLLENAEGGPSFDPHSDGGENSAIMTIELQACGSQPSGFIGLVDRLFGVDALCRGAEEWKAQITDALRIEAGDGDEEDGKSSPSVSQRVAHVFVSPWKLFFSLCCPPVCLGGGWPCFVAALLGIALLTACVSDLAELFGCVLDVPDIITAITFVALGTSMPDLFASLSAAREDPTADASIVNVTGSNSVNVFLGLGVPWSIAALYWKGVGRTAEWEASYPAVAARITGAAFVVEAGDLAFSVIAFCYACLLALFILVCRRRLVKAELGGPVRSKIASSAALITFWLGWVALVSGEVLRWSHKGASAGEYVGVLLLAIVVSIVATGGSVLLMKLDADAEVALSAAAAAAEEASATTRRAPEGVVDATQIDSNVRVEGACRTDSGRATPKEPALDPEQIAISVVDLSATAPVASGREVAPQSARGGCSALYASLWQRMLSG